MLPWIVGQNEGYLECYALSAMSSQKTGRRLERFAVDMVTLAQSAVLPHTLWIWDVGHMTPLVYPSQKLPFVRNSS